MKSLGYEAKNQTLYHAVGEFSGPIDFPKFFELLTARSSAKDTK
jgi:Ca2+-binding EF-hand superfamily protein